MSYLKILAAPIGRDACSYYRVKQPLDEIKNQKLADVIIIDNKMSSDNLAQLVAQADIVLLRPGSELLMRVIREHNINHKLKFVFDHDDNTFLISPYSEHYLHLGEEEYYDKNIKKWLWKDGVAGFDIKRNKEKNRSVAQALSEVDMITTTTQYLADTYQEYNSIVGILPNAINFEHFYRLNLPKNDKEFRVSWHGGISHYEDLFTIKDPMTKLMGEDSRIKWINMGVMFKGIIKDIPENQVEFYDWLSPDAFSYKLAVLNLDMAVIPLEDNEFNRCKSSIKWYEYAALGIPSLVSNVMPYNIDIEDGVTGMLYKDEKEFIKKFKLLREDKNLRKDIANNAYEWVRKNRDIKDIAKKYVEMYEVIVNG